MYDVKVNTGVATYNIINLGPRGSSATIKINGQDSIHLNDVGPNKLGPSQERLGVCITFRDRVWAFRYDGQVNLNIDYDSSSNTLTLNPSNSNGIVTELTST
jgi:hypothetical protein